MVAEAVENTEAKDVTEEYTGETGEVNEEELDYEEPEEEESQVDLAQIGLDSNKIGHLTAYGLSFLVARPSEVEIDGQTYDLRGRYISNNKDQFAELADGLQVEEALAQLNLKNLTPKQILGAYAGLGGIMVFQQKRQFKKELKQLKKQNGNGKEPENKEENDAE